VAAGRTNTFLGERYRRIARRRGAKRAIVAVGRSILIIVWHLPADPDARYQDLGPGFYETRVNAERRRRNTSASSKRSATRSPSNPPPDPYPPALLGPGCAAPGAAACRSVRPSANCSTSTSASRAGDQAGRPRAENPRQLTEIALNSRCSIPFNLEVPGGEWQTVTASPVSAANLASSVCHNRTR
jgi:hypothetical protein